MKVRAPFRGFKLHFPLQSLAHASGLIISSARLFLFFFPSFLASRGRKSFVLLGILVSLEELIIEKPENCCPCPSEERGDGAKET